MKIDHLPIGKVRLNPDNPRQIGAKEFASLVKSLKDCPDMFEARPLLVSNRTGENIVLGGNMRLRAAQKLGYKDVPAIILPGLTEAQEKEITIKDNGAWGEWDYDALANAWSDLPLKDWGVDIPADWGEQKEPADAEPQIDKAAELNKKWNVKPGDLFRIGDHRLLCGDSTKREDVERVMGGERAELVFTDPPYGVLYKSKGVGRGNAISGDLSQVAIPLSFKIMHDVATNNDARIYICGGSNNAPMYFALFDSYCQLMPKMLVWVKETFILRPNNYHSQYEIIYFGWKGIGGSSDFWYGDRKMSDVWQFHRDNAATYLHPTQKPIDLACAAIGNSAVIGGIVFEPFLGSGSTMVACQNLGRKCRGIEISPNYCAVILERMKTAFPEIEIERVQ